MFESGGEVVAVCTSPTHGFPKYPRTDTFVGTLGIPGDAHYGELRQSFRNPGVLKPNDRPISIVADEVRQELNAKFSRDIQPGQFNEQLLVKGLGDLGYVAIGDQVHFDTGLQLEVVDYAWPCTALAEYLQIPEIIKTLAVTQDGKRYSRRGILAKVCQPGRARPGARLVIVPAGAILAE